MMTTSAMPTSIPIDSIQRPFGPVRSDRLHGHWLQIPGESWLDRDVAGPRHGWTESCP